MDRCRLLLLSLFIVLPLAAAADERADAAKELGAVRERIQKLQAELQREGKRRSRAERELQELEQDEQRAHRELRKIRTDITTARDREKALQAEAAAQRAALDGQRTALAAQLRAAYVTGEAEQLRVLLSQEDPAELGRRMAYYGYLSRERQAAIDELRASLVTLTATEEQIAAEVRRLQQLESAAADKLESIADTRAERATVVRDISKTMASRDAEIGQLRAQEQELGELLAKLAKRLPAMPATNAEPFAGQTDRLAWPADGPVLKRFGQPRADGSLKWNGVLLGAKAGSEVRAVYHGRVVFAEWLTGMGLLTIVEHDGGFMSLYGHNQDLVRDVGDWVRPGDVIGHVGDSGGQANTGLYFEIRKNGKPVNPQNWLK